jgi:hypothetical protein
MVKTYAEHIAETKQEIREEGYEQDSFMDIAEAMLLDSEFLAQAMKRFGVQNKSELKACVADSLC